MQLAGRPFLSPKDLIELDANSSSSFGQDQVPGRTPATESFQMDAKRSGYVIDVSYILFQGGSESNQVL